MTNGSQILGWTFVIMMTWTAGFGQRCIVRGSKTDETTRLGGNFVVDSRESTILRDVRGFVKDGNDGPFPDALVEILDHRALSSGQERRIGCIANRLGYFGVVGLRKGSYELRISMNGFNTSHAYIRVDPKRGRRKILTRILNPGS